MSQKIFDDINSLPILDVLTTAHIWHKKDSWSPYMYSVLKPDGSVDKSFKINESMNIAVDFWGSGIKGGVFDIIWRLVLGVDTSTSVWKVATIKWFVDKGLVKNDSIKKTFEKSLKKEELLERFDEFKLGWYKNELSKFLMGRGFSHEWIGKNTTTIWEVFKDVGFYDNFFCSEFELKTDEYGKIEKDPKNPSGNVMILMFPCLDGEDNMVGFKIRRIDGKTIYGKKSYAVGKTGIWHTGIKKGTAHVCEWETDWVVLHLLGYRNTISNLAWVQWGKAQIKSKLYDCPKVVCLYDDDEAGQLGKKSLAEYMGRSIFQVDMPIRQDSKWRKLSDINDLYRVGYDNRKKWDKILSWSYEIWDINDGAKQQGHRYIFLDRYLEFYDTKYKRIQNKSDVAGSLWLTAKELHKMVEDNVVRKYEDLCYQYGGKEWFYNTLDESLIMNDPGDASPRIHPHIEALISNIAWHKKKNIEWIHKAILFKLTHINDVNVPAVILYGSWWSGKWTFINLLSKIFWAENTQIGLGQRDLEWGFDSYAWGKLIVEFKEISSGNTAQDKKILDRIKWFIWEKRITVNEKFQNAKEVDNIAWFHMSSNHSIPIQLDSKHSGNRRFTIIKTGNMLNTEVAVEMNRVTFKDQNIIKGYIAWLYENYPDVVRQTSIEALDNDEKKMLEESCEWVANQFFEWMESEYPLVWKFSIKQKKVLLDIYRSELGDNEFNDKRFTQKNFDNSLTGRYMKKKIRLSGKNSVFWYFIEKDSNQKLYIPESANGEFSKEEWIKIEHRLAKANILI